MSKELSRRSFLKGAAAAAVLGVTGLPSVKAKAAASYTPGTYTATATGMGTVTMTATFSEDAITDIVLDVSQETEGIGKAAAECLKNCIAQATGTTVSAVVEDAAPVEHDVWYDAEYFAKPDPITDIAETVETDVVVVGAGNGGLVAAASTADLGAKVILVEKNATWITWAGEMGAYNSKIMNEKYGISYTDEELLEISNEICRYAGYECDQRLINLWLFNSGRTMDWFTDRMEEKGIHMFLE